jgi:GTP-binding protein Era
MITIAGRPNVGKSTLVNALVGEKIAIVSPKPQTTRNRIYAVIDRGDTQVILLDTPGFHRARTKLGEQMVRTVRESIADVDAVALVVEPVASPGDIERELIAGIKQSGCPGVLVINKIDTVEKEKLFAVISAYAALHDFDAVVPISAKNGDGTQQLLAEFQSFAKSGPKLFPEGEVTDQPERQVCAELIREKLLLCLDKEIPHGTAVVIDRFSERIDTEIIDIDATIYCEKSSHKGIIIGKNGAMLKKIGALSRADIERFMGAKVFLQTWVKVKENWRDNASLSQRFTVNE